MASGSEDVPAERDIPAAKHSWGIPKERDPPKHRQRGSRRVLPSAMKCSGTWSVTLTVSGQESWEPQTTASTQELTAISVSAVLFTGLLVEPARHTQRGKAAPRDFSAEAGQPHHG